ncbi:hypothetical protein EES37_07330 [Streptomyces sp. ADI91-18]|nr:hypothetical protein EES37_07330 [Streptomyces sp. ADI91-18]
MPGQWVRRRSASSAAAPMTCSQLSRTRSVGARCAQCSRSRAVGSSGTVFSRATRTVSRMPRALRTASGTASGWSRRASSTSQAGSGWAAAACSARRVFPEPPGPVRVMRRWRGRSARREPSSGSRPTKEVRRGRRLPSGARGGGGRRSSACRAASSGPGSVPRPSARARRVCSYASRASAGRPAARRTRSCWARRRSSYGCCRIRVSISWSSAAGSAPPPRSSASMRSRRAVARCASAEAAWAVRAGSGRSARAGPCQRPRAVRRVVAAAGSPAASSRAPARASRVKRWRSTSSRSATARR